MRFGESDGWEVDEDHDVGHDGDQDEDQDGDQDEDQDRSTVSKPDPGKADPNPDGGRDLPSRCSGSTLATCFQNFPPKILRRSFHFGRRDGHHHVGCCS